MGSAGCLFVWAMELFVFDRKVGKWEMREFGNPGNRNSEFGYPSGVFYPATRTKSRKFAD